jgi:hypothetical protein
MDLPLGDWQFYVVSLAALAGLWVLVRQFLPRRRFTSLTIRGRRCHR